ncbi:MAG: DNA-deoxyinosine glycosylase [Clostridiales bacterium GWF2_38_85]|nr:MAG: DNA-deoxyinosine glycosylase [Clostridiales bacterium GWF2_38_85]HBL84973.1 DNA-deoxyinosine glycosylase [Clostridiales bacterium]
MNTIIHNIQPVYNQESKILILGSFPSPKSRDQGFFYGHPQNRFWKVLAAVLEKKVPENIDEKREILLLNYIAMWDVIYSCEIKGAADASIKNPIVNDFDIIFDVAKIKTVFTTGITATNLYNKLTGKDSIALPSPSPANAAMNLDILIRHYKIILDYIK